MINKMTEVEKTEYRKKRAEQQKQRREAKKLKVANKDLNPYKTKAAIGKAVCKVKRALPSDPVRAKAVLEENLKKINDEIGDNHEDIFAESTRGYSQEIKDIVKKFYLSYNISVEFPGFKDYVNVKHPDGTCEKMQKHILGMTLKEAHSQFKQMYPDLGVSLDVFSKLRPPNVLCHVVTSCLRMFVDVSTLITSTF